MSDKKKELQKEDLASLYDLVWTQFKEDREAVQTLYSELKTLLAGNLQSFAISGDTLAKYAELMTKQTAQVIELIKLAHKETEKESALTDDEKIQISEAIGK